MNVNKHSFTKYIDFFDFFNFCTKEKSFTLDSQRRNISRMNPHLFWLKFARSSSRNGLSDFLLTVLRLQLEISKQLKPEIISSELLKSNRGNEEKSSRMVKKGIKVFRADLPTNLSENSY